MQIIRVIDAINKNRKIINVFNTKNTKQFIKKNKYHK